MKIKEITKWFLKFCVSEVEYKSTTSPYETLVYICYTLN